MDRRTFPLLPLLTVVILLAVIVPLLPTFAAGCSCAAGDGVATETTAATVATTATTGAATTASTAASTATSVAQDTTTASSAPSTSTLSTAPGQGSVTTGETTIATQPHLTLNTVPNTTLGEPPTTKTTTSLVVVVPTITLVTVDPWKGFQETDPRLHWTGPWTDWKSGEAGGGGYRALFSAGSVLIHFNGQRIVYHAMMDPRNGVAKVTLDGSNTYMVDLYAPTFYSKAVWVSDPVPAGDHTLLIQWTGLTNPASINTFIQFDAVWVYGTLID